MPHDAFSPVEGNDPNTGGTQRRHLTTAEPTRAE